MRKILLVFPRLLAALLLFAVSSGGVGAQVAADPARVGANESVPAAPAGFGYGVNFGNPSGWNNKGLSTVAARAGADSARIKLPEYHFDRWGYDIEFANGDMAAYQANGLTNMTGLLIGPTAAHSNSPTGGSLDQYSPKNLYQPIWSSPGVVNPNNYWAAYVHGVVSRYRGQVKIWEVWNEPDLAASWSSTQGAWWSSPPKAGDLPNWHDSIFAYIRLLRVTYEVAKAVDPSSFVATGGIGYESFLDALLRYSDNPTDGSVTSAYPARGGAWFDAVSYHHYPHFATYDQANQSWLRGTDSDAMASSLLARQSTMRIQLERWGYNGATYPRKIWLATESGVSSKPIGSMAGGSELQRNYMLKLPILAQAGDVTQVDWFQLADTEADSSGSSAYAHMGLYYDLRGQTVDSARLKPSAAAFKSYGAFLSGQRYDAAATAALGLPAGVRGYVFRMADGRKSYALWAATSGNSESATATMKLSTTSSLVERKWDFGVTQATRTLTPSGGSVTVSLTASPLFLTEGTGGSSGPIATPTPTSSPTNTPAPTATPTVPPATATPTATVQPTATPTSASPPSGNLLSNAGFELDGNGDGDPDGWQITSPGAPLVSRSGSQHSEGSFSLLADSTKGESFVVYQDLPVKPGEVYDFSGKMNVPSRSGWFRAGLQLLALNPSGRALTTATALSQSSTTSGWVSRQTSLTVPKDATTLRVQLKLEYLRAGVYVDGFSLTRTR